MVIRRRARRAGRIFWLATLLLAGPAAASAEPAAPCTAADGTPRCLALSLQSIVLAEPEVAREVRPLSMLAEILHHTGNAEAASGVVRAEVERSLAYWRDRDPSAHLAEVVGRLASIGDIADAMMVAQEQDGNGSLLARIAYAQTDAHDANGAAQTLEKALALARRARAASGGKSPELAHAFHAIAVAMAHNDAMADAQRIEAERRPLLEPESGGATVETLMAAGTVDLLGAQGAFDAAYAAAGKLADADLRVKTLQHIVAAQAMAGDIPGAAAALRRVGPLGRDSAIYDFPSIVVEKLITNGRFADARALMEGSGIGASDAWDPIAITLLKNHDADGAQAVVSKLASKEAMSQALHEVVLLRIDAGDMAGALASAELIPDPVGHISALCRIASAQALFLNDRQAAQASLEKARQVRSHAVFAQPKPESHQGFVAGAEEADQAIATTAVMMGDLHQALRKAEADNSDDELRALMIAFLETGDFAGVQPIVARLRALGHQPEQDMLVLVDDLMFMGNVALARGVVDHMNDRDRRLEGQRTIVFDLAAAGKAAEARSLIAPHAPPVERAVLLAGLAGGEAKAGQHDAALGSLGAALAAAQEARKAKELAAANVTLLLDVAHEILGSGLR